MLMPYRAFVICAIISFQLHLFNCCSLEECSETLDERVKFGEISFDDERVDKQRSKHKQPQQQLHQHHQRKIINGLAIDRYCLHLQNHLTCLKKLRPQCHSKMMYHSVITLVLRDIKMLNCSSIVTRKSSGSSDPDSLSSLIAAQGAASKAAAKEAHRRARRERCTTKARDYSITSDVLKQSKLNSDPGLIKSQDFEADDAVSPSLVDFDEEIETRWARDIDSSANSYNHRQESNSSNDRNETESGEERSPLLCIIFGDPHLRTLDQRYQTCKCHGAWPLIDHPLFLVEITNEPSGEESSDDMIYGVTRVTILLRKFKPCKLVQEVYYMVDARNLVEDPDGEIFPNSFTDGSKSKAFSLIEIQRQGDRVEVHLGHVGITIIIAKFDASFLNVAIKYDQDVTAAERDAIMAKLDDHSLCVGGCPEKEEIDIKEWLSSSFLFTVNQKDFSILPKDIAKCSNAKLDGSTNINDDYGCEGLLGFYRISCIYDLTFKTHSQVCESSTFAQSLDNLKAIVSFEQTYNQTGKATQRNNKNSAIPLDASKFLLMSSMIIVILNCIASKLFVHIC